MIFQLGSPLLDACVLAVLQKEDAYGYFLTQQVQKVVDISESTLYPVLRRLQKELCLETYDQPYQGRNRRYYRLTGEGRERCRYYIREWKVFKEAIDALLEGDVPEKTKVNLSKGSFAAEEFPSEENTETKTLLIEDKAVPEGKALIEEKPLSAEDISHNEGKKDSLPEKNKKESGQGAV